MRHAFLSVMLLLATCVTAVQAQLEEYDFDMGTASSPVETGYRRVTANTVYDATQGFGWTRPVQTDFDVNREVPQEFLATHPNHACPVGELEVQ